MAIEWDVPISGITTVQGIHANELQYTLQAVLGNVQYQKLLHYNIANLFHTLKKTALQNKMVALMNL